MTKKEVTDIPAEESKKPEEKPAAPADDKKAEEKEPTISETFGDEEGDQKPASPKKNLIPEAAFLEEKKGRKAAEAALKELQDKIAAGESSKEEISDDIGALAEEYGIDPNFLKKFQAATTAKAKAEAKRELEEAEAAKRKPQEEKERAEKIDAAFKKGFGAAMEKFPELKEIVVPSVIKTLSLDPSNRDKTFTQLIEETYGSARSGKRTIESSVPRGGKEPAEIDYARARKDTNYFKEIMADPQLKKKYNENIESRINL